MGGRIALHAALAHPDRVARLVLIGVTAGIEDPTERVARRASDADLATRIVEIGVARFVDEWLAGPLFAGLGADAAGRDARLLNTAAGLASSLRRCGTGSQEPLWERLVEIRCPTLVVVGARDAKFTALGRRLASLIPDAHLEIVADAGHSVHLEQPGPTASLVAGFLSG
jgi:2-succinyl-6-hydroxy-2,4-cyclohexadiene-1-carboxylate synthase